MATSLTISIHTTITLAHSNTSSLISSSKSQVTTSKLTKYTGVVTSNKLDIRSTNSTKGKILDTLIKKDVVEVTKKMKNGWYEIKFDNKLGYVNGKHLKITSDNVPPYELKSTDKVIGTGIVKTRHLSVRRGCNSTYSKIGSLREDSSIKILSKLKNGWYKVAYQEGYGFVNGKYILLLADTSSKAHSEYLKIQDIVSKNSNGITRLVNKQNALKSNYKPNDLVKISVKSTKTIHLRKNVAKAVKNMFSDAKKKGIHLTAVSGFRSSSYQSNLYYNSLRKNGAAYTNKYFAKPNHSEHQTGMAIDISAKSVGYDLIEHFKNTKEGKWLAKNAHKYGFILRYKEGREKDTGFAFEPWHFRYVGEDVASYIYKNNLILEDLYR